MQAFQIVIVVFTVLTNLLLGLISYRNNPKSITNRLLSIITLIIALWAVANYYSLNSPVEQQTLFWIRAVMLITSPLGPVLYLFLLAFPRPDLDITKKRLIFILLLIFATATVSLTPWMFSKVEIDGGIHPTPGPGIILYGTSAIGFLLAGLREIVVKYKKSRGLIKLQLKYLVLGVILTFTLQALTNFILVVVFNFSNFVILGPIFSLILVAFMTYAIVKHRLMDIRLVIARAISYTFLSLIVVALYALSVFVIGSLLFPVTANISQIAISVMLALVVVYTFLPLRRFLERVTDKIFFQENYNAEELLGKISRILATTLELNTLINSVLQELLPTIHLNFGVVYLAKKDGLGVITKGVNSKEIEFTNKQVKLLISKKINPIIFDELGEGNIKKLMRRNEIGAIVKLSVKHKLIGILVLGQKLAGDIYTNSDIEVLEILGPQLAVALQNAQRYEEIKQFSKRLEIKVKKATSDLRLANEKLREMDRQKDEFISMAAHELRAPMTAIKGYLSMIAEEDAGEIPEKARDFLAEADAINNRVIRLVNNMLNVSRIEKGRLIYQMGTVSLTKVAEKVFESFKLEARSKGLRYSFKIPSNIKDEVYVDPDRIHEVVANLVSNAIKYTDGGSVVIELSQPDKKTVRLEVADTGPGISEAGQKKLFRKYYRVKSTVGKTIGTGLGLYISKLLVEKFKGEIGVESEADKGSTFWIELPVKRNRGIKSKSKFNSK